MNFSTSIHNRKKLNSYCLMFLLLLVCLISLFSNRGMSNELPTIRYAFIPSLDELDQQTIQEIRQTDTLNTVQELSDSVFNLAEPVNIVFGTEDGPLYDPESDQIEIPYHFWREMIDNFSADFHDNTEQAKLSQEDSQYVYQAAEGALLHTLLHEVGHAYIALNQVPIVGKEEDAADSFANVLMLNYLEDGDSQAIHAATLFAIEDKQIDSFDDLDFIDEHSLDIQRYYYSLCLIYGSDPEQYQTLFQDLESEVKTEREEICIEEFDRVTASWTSYFKNG
ncbi:DUF4344 domain-containing metallopeptidase [Photobacterium rosenbergii]|uniref:DUF4344 domain-containing metallopeptidase n=1 Tax=Photobacterium rosenbergii TaxID=294936 RepID=A0ABU3ZBN5_9GAMM|nr:DUF4344 domain-containing metallopeptidase [Photobacterium rosenbergii]MDV5167532.1 DUF4344 domain-containing metallopeptidase [Photobacterium rosenbergii]